MSTPKKSKDAINARSASRINLRLIGTIAAVIGIPVIFFIFCRNDSLYSVNKDTVKNDVGALLDQVHPSTRQVYSDITDRGCDSASSTGLAKYIHCEVVGYKYFSIHDSPIESIQQLNQLLTNKNWRKDNYTHYSDTVRQNDQQILDAVTSGSVGYPRDNWRTAYVVLMLPGDRDTSNSHITDLINKNKIQAPSANETLFGVSVVETYWSCRGDSIFKLPCPSPPSKAEAGYPQE